MTSAACRGSPVRAAAQPKAMNQIWSPTNDMPNPVR
jgi:hypothetical protein